MLLDVLTVNVAVTLPLAGGVTVGGLGLQV
jgi:hypothetical protein